MSMRRLSFTLLCGLMLVIVPAAIAGMGATGDGVLELRDVNATTVTIKGSKGVIWGQIDKGSLRVTDLNPDDNVSALVSGGWLKLPTSDPATVLYIGSNIHFRFPGGKYQLTIAGSGIDFTAVGVGKAWLAGDPDTLDDGDYALDGGKWQPVPVLKKLITFGVQPPVVSSP
jgi:hypothetical protein